MPTEYLFPALAIVFLGLGGVRYLKDKFQLRPASKTWLLMGAIFSTVAVWLVVVH